MVEAQRRSARRPTRGAQRARWGRLRSELRADITFDRARDEADREQQIVGSDVGRVTGDPLLDERPDPLDRGELCRIGAGEVAREIEGPIEGLRKCLEQRGPILWTGSLMLQEPIIAGGSDIPRR